MSLNIGIQDRLRSGVTQRRPVLVQQVHQLLGDSLGGQYQVLPPVLLHGVVLGPGHVLCYLPGWELCFTNITKVSRQMNSFSWKINIF